VVNLRSLDPNDAASQSQEEGPIISSTTYAKVKIGLKNPQNMAIRLVNCHLPFFNTDINDLKVDLSTPSSQDISLHVTGSHLFLKDLPSAYRAFSKPTVIDMIIAFDRASDFTQGITPNGLLAFFQGGKTMDISRFDVMWEHFGLQTNGTLALDEDLQPIAAFSAKIRGLSDLLMVFAEAHLIKKQAIPFIQLALQGFTYKHPTEPSKEYHQVGITFQEGSVSLGSIPLWTYPPVLWKDLSGD
jgi:hypothetical protein